MRFHTVNHALHWYARQVGHDRVRATWSDPTAPPADRTPGNAVEGWHLTREAIRRALDRLPPAERRVLELYHLEDLPVVDIAARWNRSPSAVYGRLAQATHRLAAQLRAEELLPTERP